MYVIIVAFEPNADEEQAVNNSIFSPLAPPMVAIYNTSTRVRGMY